MPNGFRVILPIKSHSPGRQDKLSLLNSLTRDRFSHTGVSLLMSSRSNCFRYQASLAKWKLVVVHPVKNRSNIPEVYPSVLGDKLTGYSTGLNFTPTLSETLFIPTGSFWQFHNQIARFLSYLTFNTFIVILYERKLTEIPWGIRGVITGLTETETLVVLLLKSLYNNGHCYSFTKYQIPGKFRLKHHCHYFRKMSHKKTIKDFINLHCLWFYHWELR